MSTCSTSKNIHKQTVDVHIQFDFLNEHLYLSGVWLGADPRTDIMKRCVPKSLDYMFKI